MRGSGAPAGRGKEDAVAPGHTGDELAGGDRIPDAVGRADECLQFAVGEHQLLRDDAQALGVVHSTPSLDSAPAWAIARTRSAREMIPTSRPSSSVTGSRFTPRRCIADAASHTLAVGVTV